MAIINVLFHLQPVPTSLPGLLLLLLSGVMIVSAIEAGGAAPVAGGLTEAGSGRVGHMSAAGVSAVIMMTRGGEDTGAGLRAGAGHLPSALVGQAVGQAC